MSAPSKSPTAKLNLLAGMPPDAVQYDVQLAKAATNLANTWHTADVMGIGGASPRDADPSQLKDWTSEQVKLNQQEQHSVSRQCSQLKFGID